MKIINKIFFTAMVLLGVNAVSAAAEVCPQVIKDAINKYKEQDYIGCIQDLEDYSETDPTNAVAYYYTSIAYMQLGLKDRAIGAFDKVTMLNTIPVLSSYSVQATHCMNDGISPCKYKRYSREEIAEMVQDPAAFFAEDNKGTADDSASASDFDSLINGKYRNGIHPDANRVIQETKLIQEQERVNTELKKIKNKSDASADKKLENPLKQNKLAMASDTNPSDKEIADALKTLNKAGYKFVSPNDNAVANNTNQGNDVKRDFYKQMAAQYALNDDVAQMAMMFGNNNNNNNNMMDAMLPYLLMQEQGQNADGTQKKVNPELIKTMMMQQMMGSFDFGFNDNNR